MERLGEFLPGALVRQKIYIDAISSSMTLTWRTAVGPQIARQTEPSRFRDGTLSVRVSTPAWMQQLLYMKEDILEKLNACAPPGTVKNIRFSIGAVPAGPPSALPAASAPFSEAGLRERDRRLIAENLEAVEDEELREILRRVMIRECLTRPFRS